VSCPQTAQVFDVAKKGHLAICDSKNLEDLLTVECGWGELEILSGLN